MQYISAAAKETCSLQSPGQTDEYKSAKRPYACEVIVWENSLHQFPQRMLLSGLNPSLFKAREGVVEQEEERHFCLHVGEEAVEVNRCSCDHSDQAEGG